MKAAFAEAEKINLVASDYIADSELLMLPRQPHGQPVKLSPLLFRLVSEARQFAEKTDGAFDPTLGPLTKLWRESRRRKKLPDAEILAVAKEACGWRHLLLDQELFTATFERPGMRLDLGGIAKGQAADAMLAVMTKHGIPASCITAGGDVRVGDPPPHEKGWNVTVKRTTTNADETRNLSNSAVSTSGDLHQFIEIEGIRYSHIIDPATGLGLTNRVSATIFSPDATTSDALATACCVLPAERAKEIAMACGATEIRLEQ